MAEGRLKVSRVSDPQSTRVAPPTRAMPAPFFSQAGRSLNSLLLLPGRVKGDDLINKPIIIDLFKNVL